MNKNISNGNGKATDYIYFFMFTNLSLMLFDNLPVSLYYSKNAIQNI